MRCEICMIADQDGGLVKTEFQTAKGRTVATLNVCVVCRSMAEIDRIRVTAETLKMIQYIAHRHTYVQHTRSVEVVS